jgi:hypothetical protein
MVPLEFKEMQRANALEAHQMLSRQLQLAALRCGNHICTPETHTYTRMHTTTHVYAHTHSHSHTQTHTHTHRHTHTHTRTHTMIDTRPGVVSFFMQLPIACLDELCEVAATPKSQRRSRAYYARRALQASCTVAVTSGVLSFCVGYLWASVPESWCPQPDCAFERRVGSVLKVVRVAGQVLYTREISVRVLLLFQTIQGDAADDKDIDRLKVPNSPLTQSRR